MKRRLDVGKRFVSSSLAEPLAVPDRVRLPSFSATPVSRSASKLRLNGSLRNAQSLIAVHGVKELSCRWQ
jgi:hypothetical protein